MQIKYLVIQNPTAENHWGTVVGTAPNGTAFFDTKESAQAAAVKLGLGVAEVDQTERDAWIQAVIQE